jgi:hypothetical protein
MSSNLDQRVGALEDRHDPQGDRCPGCGHRPDDIRGVVVVIPRGSEGPTAAERNALEPPIPCCAVCGGPTGFGFSYAEAEVVV